MQTTSHQKMLLKDAKFPAHLAQKAEVELPKPYFYTQAGLIISDFCRIILF